MTDDVSGFNKYALSAPVSGLPSDGSADKSTELSLVFFDLDNFKQLVDTHGHLLGTKALREVVVRRFGF